MTLNPGQIASIVEGGIGLTTAIGGAIWGGARTRRLNKKAENRRKSLLADNDSWWNIKRASDYTQRADYQAANKIQRDMLMERYNSDAARNFVAGGTDESLALQKEAANKAMAQAETSMAARAADYNDEVERQYRAQDYALRQQGIQNLQQRAAATAQAASQVVNTGLQMTGNSFQHFAQASGGGGGDLGKFFSGS